MFNPLPDRFTGKYMLTLLDTTLEYNSIYRHYWLWIFTLILSNNIDACLLIDDEVKWVHRKFSIMMNYGKSVFERETWNVDYILIRIFLPSRSDN
jgi:hypothetical protein